MTIHHMRLTSQPHGSKLDNHHELFYTTKKCEECCCLCSCTLHRRHHFHTERFTTEMQRFIITLIKEIAQEQCVCRACELSIKRSMKIKDNDEVYKLRKTFALFHLVPLFVGRGTSC